MSRFIAKALKNEPITIYGDGQQSRTFCYVDDNIDACLRSAYENFIVNDVVNIGSDSEISILSLAHKIIELTHSQSQIEYLPPLQEGDMQRRLPDITMMKQLLNRPLTSIDEGIKRILENTKYILY